MTETELAAYVLLSGRMKRGGVTVAFTAQDASAAIIDLVAEVRRLNKENRILERRLLVETVR